jgi:hypothetical protein
MQHDPFSSYLRQAWPSAGRIRMMGVMGGGAESAATWQALTDEQIRRWAEVLDNLAEAFPAGSRRPSRSPTGRGGANARPVTAGTW